MRSVGSVASLWSSVTGMDKGMAVTCRGGSDLRQVHFRLSALKQVVVEMLPTRLLLRDCFCASGDVS